MTKPTLFIDTILPNMLFYTLIAVTILTILIYFTCKLYPRPYPGIPYNTPSSKRMMGDLPELLQYFRVHKETGPFLFSQCTSLKSPIIQLFIRPMSAPFIVLTDARETEDIMLRRTKEFDRAPSTSDIFKPLIPHASIVKQTTPEFKRQRRLWMDVMKPTFLRRVVAPNIHKSSMELVELWKEKALLAEGRPFAVQSDFETAAFDAIWVAILGSELGGTRADIKALKTVQAINLPDSEEEAAILPSTPRSELYQAIAYLNHSVEKIMASPSPTWHHWFIRQTAQYKNYNAIKDHEIRKIMRGAHRRFRDILEKDNVGEEHDTCAVDLVLRREMVAAQSAGLPLLKEENLEIQDELLMLLVAGHETTATTLGWAVKFLANNPAKQSKLRTALERAFFHKPQSKTSHLQPSATAILTTEVTYLDATLEEISRLANTVPLLVRVATVDTEILGHKIPKGAHIMCNAQVASKPFDVLEESRSPSSRHAREKLGRDFDYERDLLGFEPERWLSEDQSSFDAYSLPRLSFSLGPRGCFGKKLAVQELRIMLVLLVLNFRFLPVPEPFNSPAGQQKVLRTAQQCYVKLEVL